MWLIPLSQVRLHVVNALGWLVDYWRVPGAGCARSCCIPLAVLRRRGARL